MNTDRFKFRVWYQPACDGIESRYFYDVESIYDGSIDGLGWISCFGDLLNDDQYVVEQCTGLKDKNGRLIYEGDVVLTVTGAIGEIRHHCCGFKVYFEEMLLYCDVLDDQEVIGNIHNMEIKK